MIAAAARQLLGHLSTLLWISCLVWTRDECSQAAKRTRETGFAGDVIALASLSGIPIVNLASGDRSLPCAAYLHSRRALPLNSAQVPMN